MFDSEGEGGFRWQRTKSAPAQESLTAIPSQRNHSWWQRFCLLVTALTRRRSLRSPTSSNPQGYKLHLSESLCFYLLSTTRGVYSFGVSGGFIVFVLSFWLFGVAVGFSGVLTLADESERTAGKSVQEKD